MANKYYSAPFRKIMMSLRLLCLWLLAFLPLSACETSGKKETSSQNSTADATISQSDTVIPQPDRIAAKATTLPLADLDSIRQLSDTAFVELLRLDTSFVLTMKYATADNFLKEKVYDCDKCLLRKQPALGLLKAQQLLKEKGYGLQLFDCYRPLDVQKKMWEIMPDDRYVGNPYGNGSVHNKGAAVDLTLTDSTGHELDMGTHFDFFGREAHHAYTHLPAEVLERRKLLKNIMQEAGFEPITSEWWHYSYRHQNYPTANFKPACE